jgi:hypothetical protein
MSNVIFEDDDLRVSIEGRRVMVQQREYRDHSTFTDGIKLRPKQIPVLVEQLQVAAANLKLAASARRQRATPRWRWYQDRVVTPHDK